MWGSRGTWPLSDPVKLHLQGSEGDGGWWAFRRLVRAYGASKAYRNGDLKGRRYARTMLKANTRELGEVRGISHWVPRDQVEAMIGHLDAMGYVVESAQVENDTGVGR